MTVYYKMRQVLLQNLTALLLQNATEVYYKIRQLFLLQNTRVLLQNATFSTNCDDFITKCGSSYKMQRLLQIVIVHSAVTEPPSYRSFKKNFLLFRV